MIVLVVVALSALFFTPTVSFRPVKFETLSINFAPDAALTIQEGETQMFRAPLCKGQFLDNWVMKAKVYMQNVPWDSAKIGDSNWLHIKVSNGPSMTKVVRDNARDIPGADPSPFTRAWRYNKNTWGSDDVYIQITASKGTPTYQFGLELAVDQPRSDQIIPDGMDAVREDAENKLLGQCGIQTLEQIAVPHTSGLHSGDTGQYKIPFCFEETYDKRNLALTTLVPEKTSEAPGGVAIYFCTSAMMQVELCFRTASIARGSSYFDASGAKVSSATPTILKEEYGPVYLLVLAQGNWHEEVDFMISTKLKHPPTDDIKLTGHSEKDLHAVLGYLHSSYLSKPPPIDPNFVADELKEEL